MRQFGTWTLCWSHAKPVQAEDPYVVVVFDEAADAAHHLAGGEPENQTDTMVMLNQVTPWDGVGPSAAWTIAFPGRPGTGALPPASPNRSGHKPARDPVQTQS